jgi:hypothetical protein
VTPESKAAARYVADHLRKDLTTFRQRSVFTLALANGLEVMPWHGEPVLDETGRGIVMDGDKMRQTPVKVITLQGSLRNQLTTHAARAAGIPVVDLPWHLIVEIRPAHVRGNDDEKGGWEEICRAEPAGEMPPITAANEYHAARLAVRQLQDS